MARVFIDGFESKDASLWSTFDNATPRIEAGQTSLWACAMTYGHTRFRKIPNSAEYHVSFKLKPNQQYYSGDISNIVSFKYDSQLQIELRQLQGVWHIRLGTTTLVTASLVVSRNVWHHVDIYYKASLSSDGRFTVSVDGQSYIDYTGITATTTALLNIFQIHGIDYYTNNIFDDIVIDNSTFIGSATIIGVVPNAAGSSTQFTPSTGTDNYALVAEVPHSTTDYVYTGTADTIDLYNVTAFVPVDVAMSSIKSIQVAATGAYLGTPAVSKLDLKVKTGGVVYPVVDTAAQSIFMTPTTIAALFEINPNTGVAWTISDMDNLEIGIKAKA